MVLCFSNERPTLEKLDFAFYIGSKPIFYISTYLKQPGYKTTNFEKRAQNII